MDTSANAAGWNGGAELAANRSALTRALPALRLFTLIGVTFCSAFLLFQVQPLISKTILPAFGGTSAVWSTCMLFFQLVLLLGYAAAHLISRLRLPYQRAAYASLAVAAWFFLRGLDNPSVDPSTLSDSPVLAILTVLTCMVGVPYFALSTTAPTLQNWFRISFPKSDPYPLYAVSNLGSLLALLTYPVVFESSLKLSEQRSWWSGSFTVYVIGILALAAALPARTAAPTIESLRLEEPSAIRRQDAILWVVFPALSSIILLGITHHITIDIAPMPLMWVIPLALYLLTFILAFSVPRCYHRGLFLFALAQFAIFFPLQTVGGAGAALFSSLIFALCIVFAACLICHGELYRLKPAPEHLTAYYLLMSLGGALGSCFTALVAPHIFKTYVELPIALSLVLVLLAYRTTRDARATGTSIFPNFPKHRFITEPRFAWALAVLASAGLFILTEARNGDAMFITRNFYASLRVIDHPAGDEGEGWRELLNGRIIHGAQFTDPNRPLSPTSYYGPTSGVGLIFEYLKDRPQRNIGVIGLGTGVSSAWAREGDAVRFYDINPAVVDIAHKYFTYLSRTPGKVDIVMGDARLSLQKEASQQFDILIVDAFSSDAIPFHLLTVEAFGHYFRHLKDNGVLAIHVSNRHLKLEPVALSIAHQLGLHAGAVVGTGGTDMLETSSSYVLVTKSPEFFNRQDVRERLSQLDGSSIAGPVWTDDFASTIRIIHWLPGLEALTSRFSKPSDEELALLSRRVLDVAEFDLPEGAPPASAAPVPTTEVNGEPPTAKP